MTSANQECTDFPIQNLPLGRFLRDGQLHVGTAIGNQIFDLTAAASLGLLEFPGLRQGTLVDLKPICLDLRHKLFWGLSADDPGRWSSHESLLLDQRTTKMTLPFEIGDYTDFYASIHHATRVGSMFRPDNPLLPNYKYVPIAYHGRSSTVIPSGENIHRPSGQLKNDNEASPTFGPCRMLDYELEVAMWVGRPNPRGCQISLPESQNYLLGLGLLNDWSARDIQKWEYQPLGPFLAKSFATTVSCWVVTLEALAPFRTARTRPAEDPKPLPYLSDPIDQDLGMWDIHLEVMLRSQSMQAQGLEPTLVSSSNFRDTYWSAGQMLTHHASNGCQFRPGDLLASGTVSGAEVESGGCLLERTWGGSGQPRNPITLTSNEQRTFLLDGDQVAVRGRCQRDGYRSIGFGECLGTVLPQNG